MRSRTRTYSTWKNMKQRCTNPNNTGYANYGGRGITFDPRWEKFEVFKADMGERPYGTTLDRIDVDGPYTKANCRWATRAEQAANTRRFKDIQKLADQAGVSYTAMRKRLARHGNPAGKRVTTTYQGRPLKWWATTLGVNYHTVLYRFRKYGAVLIPD